LLYIVVGIATQSSTVVVHSWSHGRWQLLSTLFSWLSSDIISLCGPSSHPSCSMKLSFLSSFLSLFLRYFCFWLAPFDELQPTSQPRVAHSSSLCCNASRRNLFYLFFFLLNIVGCNSEQKTSKKRKKHCLLWAVITHRTSGEHRNCYQLPVWGVSRTNEMAISYIYNTSRNVSVTPSAVIISNTVTHASVKLIMYRYFNMANHMCIIWNCFLFPLHIHFKTQT